MFKGTSGEIPILRGILWDHRRMSHTQTILHVYGRNLVLEGTMDFVRVRRHIVIFTWVIILVFKCTIRFKIMY